MWLHRCCPGLASLDVVEYFRHRMCLRLHLSCHQKTVSVDEVLEQNDTDTLITYVQACHPSAHRSRTSFRHELRDQHTRRAEGPSRAQAPSVAALMTVHGDMHHLCRNLAMLPAQHSLHTWESSKFSIPQCIWLVLCMEVHAGGW